MITKIKSSVIVAAVLGISACSAPPSVDLRAEENALKELDTQWSKTAGAHDLDGTVSYYADDASLLPPNAPIATTRQAIRAAWAPLLAPEMTVSWQVTKAEVAKAGDIGFIQGTYTLTIKGEPEADKGKLVEVWKKQADGKWKVVADIFNSDLPLPASPPKK